MFSHVTHIILYLLISMFIPVCACFVLFTFTVLLKRNATLYNLHITFLQKRHKITRNCCPTAKKWWAVVF